jgi:hypothetical protein
MIELRTSSEGDRSRVARDKGGAKEEEKKEERKMLDILKHV